MRIVFDLSARSFLNAQSEAVRSKLINDVVWIRDYPFLNPDDASKAPFLAAPGVVITLWRDDYHWMVYYLGSPEAVGHSGGPDLVIVNIGDVDEAPSVHRP